MYLWVQSNMKDESKEGGTQEARKARMQKWAWGMPVDRQLLSAPVLILNGLWSWCDGQLHNTKLMRKGSSLT